MSSNSKAVRRAALDHPDARPPLISHGDLPEMHSQPDPSLQMSGLAIDRRHLLGRSEGRLGRASNVAIAFSTPYGVCNCECDPN